MSTLPRMTPAQPPTSMGWWHKGDTMETKPFYQSKTLVFNVLAILVLIANRFGFVDFQLDSEYAAMVLAILNGILRLTTTKPVSL